MAVCPENDGYKLQMIKFTRGGAVLQVHQSKVRTKLMRFEQKHLKATAA